MDFAQAWSKIGKSAKTAGRVSAEMINRAAPVVAPLAARWDAEADRRRQLRTPEHLKALMDAQRAHNSARSTLATARTQRTAARRASKNPLSAGRRAAAVAERAARQQQSKARVDLRAARREYPATLASLAARAHAAHAVPAAVASYALSTPADWAVWPVSTSAALVAAHVGGLWLGRRATVSVVEHGGATEEERRLLERLAPSWWVEHAAGRGLGGTVTGVPELGDAGVTCAVRLDGTWTLAKLRSAADQVRALLGVRTGLALEIRPGADAAWAELVLRTRSAVDGRSMLWTPDRRGIGVDEVTGEPVELPHGRKLVAGASGMGKSVLLRTIVMPYALDPLSAVIYIDAKGEESALWSHCAREVIDPEEIAAVVAEVQDEMLWRRDQLRARKSATWTATPTAPRLLVVVDEGADLLLMDSKSTPIIEPLSNIARQGRSRLVDLIWCTQKPTVGDGIPRQILGNLTVRVVLGTASQTDTQQVMGSGWRNHLITRPGLAYVQGTGRAPDDPPVVVWDASDDALVTGLPERQPWARGGAVEPAADVPTDAAETAPAGRPVLRLVKDLPTPREEAAVAPAAPPAAALTEAESAVLDAIRAAGGPVRQSAVVDASGVSKGAVSKAVKKLSASGLVDRTEDGALVATAGEVSA